MSCYVTFGGYRNRKRITRNAIEWFIQHRKLNRFNTFIHVVDKRLWPEDDVHVSPLMVVSVLVTLKLRWKTV